MDCMICQRKENTKHLPIYVVGSEGLDICLSCEMALVHHIRELMNVASVSRKLGYQSAKNVARAKDQEFHEHGNDNPDHPSKKMMNSFYRR